MLNHRIAQLGIAVGALGVVLSLMGLFPGMTGLRPTSGVGVMQIFVFLTGFALLIFGAMLYVQYTFYSNRPHNLAQQIGVRLAATGLLIAVTGGMADLLGFGSHNLGSKEGVLFGGLQAMGLLFGFFVASSGILLFAVMGSPWNSSSNDDTPETDKDKPT